VDLDGFLNEPLTEVQFQVKPWHLLVLLGVVGAIAAYFIFRKKPEPQKPSPGAAPGASGLGDFTALGEQTEPLYDGNPLVDKARAYSQQGWTVFKVPTGQENVMSNRERFPVHIVYAAPPGRAVPEQGIPVAF